MVWNNCIIHITLATASYLFWIIAAFSSAAYFVMRYIWSNSDLDKKPLNDPSKAYWLQTRNNITSIYRYLGLILFSGALVAGYLKAVDYWGNFSLLNFKILLSIIIWLYYMVIPIAVFLLKRIKDKNPEITASMLTLAGTSLLFLNLVISNFAKIHRYL